MVFTRSSVENNTPIVQTKLTIGQPNDVYEQEADAVANQVMKMSTHQDTLIQRKCDQCEEEELQMKPLSNSISPIVQKQSNGGMGSSTISKSLAKSKGSGQKMDNTTKSFMNKGIGADFSNVKIHTDSNAIQMNQSLRAKAFTNGNDIYFNKGQYNPQSSEGKHLLAHELTHVVQQGGSGEMVQRSCREESYYSASSNYCRDDTFSTSTHPGKTCYRQIPSRDSYFSCPAGEHVCFDTDGNCEDSPDRSSLAEAKESDGSCNWNSYCVAEHTAVDFVPAVVDQAMEPFREIKREAMRGLDWRNWYRHY
ncbi:DUF4157 domain-containing protein [uncultured Aquimarina sp.]|uniref:eCIS core domain-containing protein n=1 Tax=uncultured Aquimarina sp. TaxID=575652 RepID=UPI002609D896|nr:DUF4157 domain-containing protein [uncultured Aquimarina sp.]